MFKTLLTPRLALLLAAAYVAVFAFGYGRDQGWLVNAHGNAQAVEYVGIRAAGDLARTGTPKAAYDWDRHAEAQRALTRQSNDDYYPFGYPPPFLIVADTLAALPYAASALVWIGLSLALLGVVSAGLARHRAAAAWMLAAPTTFINAYVLHTGFLTAGLLGAGLLWLETAPIAAGIAIGLLTFKPQLGILIPVALLAGGHWRVIAAAAITTAVIAAAPVALYGADIWPAFLGQLDRVAGIFSGDRTNMAMLASPYGLGRTLGLSHSASLVAQVVVGAALAAAIWRLWRSDVPVSLKGAGLVTASLLAAPYVYIYDLTALPLAVILLWRHATGFDETETYALIAATMLLFLFQAVALPMGFFATLIVGGLVVRRWIAASERPKKWVPVFGAGARSK